MSRMYIVLVNGISQRMDIEEFNKCDDPKRVLCTAPESTEMGLTRASFKLRLK